MGIIAHILTNNNQQTIQKTLDSISFADQILVVDVGSSDDTVEICESSGAIVERMDRPRNDARNEMISDSVIFRESEDDWNFMIEPWEAIVQGHKAIEQCKGNAAYATILNGKTLSKEIRFWRGNQKFVNPVYERLDTNTEQEVSTIFYSTGRTDYDEVLEIIQQWKKDKPTAISPWYYHACTLLAQGKWNDFLPISEHYMALDPSNSMSAIMNRYYYAMACVVHLKKIRPALQNLTLCLAERPLMAEFWCLMGDAFYHIAKDFNKSEEFYRNAIKLGSRRLKTDKWPMDLTKYKSYPERMIESCSKLKNSSISYYIK